MIKRKLIVMSVLAIFLGAVQHLHADPIDVDYTLTGSPGSYDLDFSVTNNMLAWPTQNVYFFSVRLSVDNIIGSPSNFIDNKPTDVNWFNSGGSATDYNNTWIDAPLNNDFLPGNTLSGFVVHIPDLAAPTAVSWSALSVSPGGVHPYTGGDNFNPPGNPGFEGLANPRAVPEPTTIYLMFMGLTVYCIFARCRANKLNPTP